MLDFADVWITNPPCIYWENYVTAKSQLAWTIIFNLFSVERIAYADAVKITDI